VCQTVKIRHSTQYIVKYSVACSVGCTLHTGGEGLFENINIKKSFVFLLNI
jgi:hypothetical protein